MDVVEQFNLLAGGATHVLDHVKHVAGVGARVEVGTFGSAVGLDQPLRFAAVTAHLHPDVAVALSQEGLDLLDHPFGGIAVGVDVDVGRLPALAPQQVEQGHSRHFALDVPQGLIHAGDGIVEHRTVAPIAVHHGHLPDLFDPRNLAPDEERFQMVLDGGGDGVMPLRKGGAPDPIQFGFRGKHFDDDQPGLTGGLGQDGSDVTNGYRGHGITSPQVYPGSDRREGNGDR